MATPKRPDQRRPQPVPYTPGSRSGVTAQVTNFATSGLALDTTVQAVNSTLGVPQQDTTGQALTNQIVTAGAQPWVPNMHSASLILQGPSITTVHTFAAASRIWGATVTYAAAQSGGSGTTQLYALVRTGGGIVLAVVEVTVAGPATNDSNTSTVSIPGIPVSSGDKIVLDVNNNGNLTGGVQRASCNVLYSVP